MPVALPDALLELLRKPSPCFVATLMADGSPQLTETWVTTDGEHVVLNIVGGMQKERNLRRDPRIAVNVADPDDVARFFEVRGRVVSMTSEGGKEGIDELSQKYLGIPYPYFSGNPDETRLVVTIEADKVNTPMRG
ncbi:PPOX class probable F420-dependent enzyme [Mycobacterium sp. BK558]|jgi:PPOX class probable F420-dependent enzyme|uniref:Pyridoxamine 5'-phosphate oxidase n=1 Tax=Mycolicibacterium chlorophenolicum TaxID=37916 RepID=A0A0J6VK42_9MYCO|nr:PPOX class F420-dependent oxidoreductase [Mycolicibacterium chlorophenolicum]KMO70604.1 Pyridoxamine 5'-phosphate oxidase [Mycolicibacterium chlorophenolicum]MBI5336526.1 PPOX class F420-dependent oxidoreductase [Mycolicibacterium rufum]RZT24490.1 PPOX class probable F420-dependent enzyme [Mycobacterium sp. BK558]